MEDLFFLIVGLAALAIPGLGVAGFFIAIRQRRRVDDLERVIRRMAARMSEGRDSASTDGQAAPTATPGTGAPGATESPATGVPSPEPAAAPPPLPEPALATPPPPPPPPPGPPPHPGARVPAGPSFEEKLTSRWLVWLGGVILALSGVFLVKVGIEAGLLGPKVRTGLGILLGAALIGGADWIRRRPSEQLIATARASYVPAALAAGGIVILYGNLYAAYALYDLLSPLFAFATLAVVALAAVALSLVHGPFLAALGIAGGFVLPVLVSTGKPSAYALFPYLLAVAATGFGMVSYKGSRWLSWLTVAGATLWPLFWYGGGPAMPGDGAIVGPYLLAVAALAVFLPPRVRTTAADGSNGRAAVAGWVDVSPVVAVTVLLLAFDLLVVVREGDYDTASLLALTAFGAGSLAVARRDASLWLLPVVAAVLAAGLMALWHQPTVLADPWQARPPVLPPDLDRFAGWSAALAVLFGVGGFVALWGAARPALYASLASATPVALLVAASLRVGEQFSDFIWATLALALATALLGAADRVGRHRDHDAWRGALGAFAIGVSASITLAATMVLSQAWLTVAVALQLPALAFVGNRLDLPAMRGVARLLAGVVLARLVLNPYILDYGYGTVPGLNWILYGYGIPAAAFIVAARMFRRGTAGGAADDDLVMLLEAGSIVFFVLMVDMEIRHLLAPDGRIDYGLVTQLEQGLHASVWGSVAFALYAGGGDRVVARWGWRLLGGLALFEILVLQCLFDNPLWSYPSVGPLPILNALLPSYLIPAVLAAAFAVLARRREETGLAILAGTAAMVLGFLWGTFELRHAFHGSELAAGSTTEMELYAYSLLWLVMAAGLLAGGLFTGSAALRYGSLVIVLLTVAKAFLFDTAELSGLYRVLSFLFLGLALVAIGFLYQRFVFRPGREQEEG